MNDFRRLSVWKKAHTLAVQAYRDTSGFPQFEKFGICAQLQRACFSIPANIAEGCGRSSDRDLARFIDIALGSAKETEYYYLLSRDLSYIDKNTCEDRLGSIIEVERMLGGLLRQLRFVP